MKLQSLMLRNSLFLLTLILALPALRATAQTKPDAASATAAQAPVIPARITQAIDETQLVRLKGNVHPLARPEFDQGIVADATPMKRMMLLLQRSPEQQAALQQLMSEQQSKDSPNFHKWLTPQQFGQQFGPADADIQVLTSWLAGNGFRDVKVGAGRTTIEFSGNIGQVRNAFRTEIHRFVVNGETRQANASDPQIPAALTPVVAGIVSLHNFPKKSMRHVEGPDSVLRETGARTPLFTTSSGFFLLGPADFAKIYNVPASPDGTGVHLAIVGTSNVNIQDMRDFRALFSLAPKDPNIVLNGPDPGIGAEEGEAVLDLQWSGAVAQNATIDFIVSEDTLSTSGVDLSSLYVVDNNTDDIMSLSFGACESGLGTENVFFSTLWEQAAAQGITVTVSAGDNGSAACDDFNTQSTATGGLAVSGIASTPFNVAVGGTDFDDVGTQATFWNTTPSAPGTRESALGYIHEVPWNNSCAAAATSSNLGTICAAAANIVAASGGPSALYAKPTWQNGVTFADSHRDVPDISLFSSVGSQSKSAYVTCQADGIPAGSPPSCASSGSFSFFRTGGTSASAPAFAAIMALIDQKMGGRQGNANFVLYKLAATASNSCNSSIQTLTPPSACVFYDVTKGNNAVPCAGNSPNCSSKTTNTNGVLVDPANLTTPAWTTKAGYDYATGIGTVNVTNLATAWQNAVGTFTGTTANLTINGSAGPVTGLTHGASVTAAVTVSPATGTTKPTGDVSLLGSGGTVSIDDGTLAAGTVSISTAFLPGGTSTVVAHYAGDGTFAPSDSNAVSVTVSKENAHVLPTLVTSNGTGAICNGSGVTVHYGDPYLLRVDVNTTGTLCSDITTKSIPTGTITLTDNSSPLDGSPLPNGVFSLNAEGFFEDQPIQLSGGTRMIVATYSGDSSYNGGAGLAATYVVNVLAASTQASDVAAPTNATTATPVTLTATVIAPTSNGAGPTGTVVFSANGTAIPGTPTIVTVPANFNVTPATPPTLTATLVTTFATAGTKAVSAAYATGDANYASSSTTTSATVTVTQAQVGSFTVDGSAATATAGASGMSTITVTPTGGFLGNVNVTCPAAALPPGVTCTPNPLGINVPGAAAVTGSLTVSVAAPSATLTASSAQTEHLLYAAATIPSSGGKGWWTLSASTGLAAMFLLFLPGRKRYRAPIGLGLVCALSFSLGCGSSAGGGGGGGGGPVATVTHLTVTAPTKVASGAGDTFAFVASVTGGTPTGQVQLFDGTTALASGVTVSGGSAPITSNGLSVGTHSISAHYLGTASTQASQSGALNVTVTGTTTFAITTTPAPSSIPPLVNISIN